MKSDHAYVIGFGILAVTVGFVVAFGGMFPLSLLTETGYTEEQANAVCEAGTCERLIRRLKETGFPRATDASVETYALTSNGTIKQVVVLDWENERAEILDHLPGPATVTLDLPGPSYDYIVATFVSVRDGAPVPEDAPRRAVAIWLHSGLDVADTMWGGDLAYKWRLSTWAASYARGG